jgi:hypothetical protein
VLKSNTEKFKILGSKFSRGLSFKGDSITKLSETFAELCLCISAIDEQKKVIYILCHKLDLKVLSSEMDPAKKGSSDRSSLKRGARRFSE